MSIQSWAARRSSKENQGTESQELNAVFQSLVMGEITPEETARAIATITEPLIRANPSDARIGSVWGVLCDVVRERGGDPQISKDIVDLILALKNMQVEDEHGNVLKHGPNEYWANLPMFALTFREYGIGTALHNFATVIFIRCTRLLTQRADIEPQEGLETSEWLAQKTDFLNATMFAATAFTRSTSLSGMSFYIPSCMREALEGPYDAPNPLNYAVVYVPAACAWISIAGPKIYKYCDSEMATGFRPDSWDNWKIGFGKIAADRQFDDELRAAARMAQDTMRRIEMNSQFTNNSDY